LDNSTSNNQPGPSTTTDFVAPRDGVYEEDAPPPILEYDYVHQKDVFWEKRIWRVIDVREKMNHFFTYPKAPLINIMVEHAQARDIQLYNGAYDDFTVPLDEQQLMEIGGSYDTIVTYDPETFEPINEVVYNELDPKDIKQFRVKEVWFFDEETSRLQVRILGIAPIKDVYDDAGNYLFSMPMFWAYYPELRYELAKHKAFNPMNDASSLSWFDIFEARYFSSYIYKESNVYDRRIQDYKNGIDILYEAEDIKNTIFNFEHDLWEY